MRAMKRRTAVWALVLPGMAAVAGERDVAELVVRHLLAATPLIVVEDRAGR